MKKALADCQDTADAVDTYIQETVHLYARSVGPIMVGWWRNYWLLRRLLAKGSEG